MCGCECVCVCPHVPTYTCLGTCRDGESSSCEVEEMVVSGGMVVPTSAI